MSRLQGALQMGFHGAAEFCEMGVGAFAVRKQSTELPLKFLDCARQRWMCHVAFFRRLSEIEGAADDQKASNLMHFHAGTIALECCGLPRLQVV